MHSCLFMFPSVLLTQVTGSLTRRESPWSLCVNETIMTLIFLELDPKGQIVVVPLACVYANMRMYYTVIPLTLPISTPTHTRLPRTRKPLRIFRIPAQILRRRRPVIQAQVHIEYADVSTRRHGAALQARHVGDLGRPR